MVLRASVVLLALAPPAYGLTLAPAASRRARHPPLRLCEQPPPQPPPLETPPPPAEAEGTKTYSEGWSGEGRFADEDPLPLSFWMFGNSPRRAILSALPFYFIAPAVNLWGSGSFLLSLFPELSRDKRLDTFYPVGTQRGYPYSAGFPQLNYDEGFKRYFDEREPCATRLFTPAVPPHA